MRNLILIDGHSLAYRMYFALERTQMKTSHQFPTWGVYGFFKALFDLLKLVEPDGIAIAFDHARETFRSEMYPQYKAHRNAMPDSMRIQMEKILEGVGLLGIPVFQIPDYEADDVIGTLARQAADAGIEVIILTGDQDAFQVVDDDLRISVLLPSYQGGLARYDRQKVYEKWGVYPHQVTDFKGLKGDASDNIPGVPGIGDKTAVKLLTEYETLERVLENAESVSGNKVRQALLDHREQAILSKDLATIRYDAPVTFTQADCHLSIPDLDDFLKFLTEMEFRTLVNQSHHLLKPFLSHLNEVKTPSEAFPDSDYGQTDAPEAADDAPITVTTEVGGHFEVRHTIVRDAVALAETMAAIQACGVFAIDIETSGLDIMTDTFAGIALSWTPGLIRSTLKTRNPLGLADIPDVVTSLAIVPEDFAPLETVYIPLDHPIGEGTAILSEDEVLAAIKPLLEDPTLIKLCHNAKFERNIFRRHGIILNGLVFDTMIASYIINPDRRHGLKNLAHDVLGYKVREITELIGKGKTQVPFTRVGVDEAAAYAACDTHLTLELAARFLTELTPEGLSLLYEIELPVIDVLAEMEWQGISLDTDYLQGLSGMLDGKMHGYEEEIYELADERFNLNSPKQVGDILFGKLKIPARGRTPTKSGFTTNAKVIESLAPDYPIVQKLLDYRQVFKLKSTYVDNLPQLISSVDGRLHTSFNQTVAGTGRLSSSDPNLQNIPIRSDLGRSIRQAFVPAQREDWLILSADYSQIELRLLAHFSEDPKLIEAFRSGEDVHRATAALVFDVPLTSVTKEMRYRAKAVNFGIIYGQTAYGLANTLKIPPREAGEFIDRYFAQYSKVREYIDRAKAAIRISQTAKTLGGRVRDFSDGLTSPVKGIREFSERAAFNLPLQGSAADLVKLAMIRVHQGLQSEGFQSKLILQVHDELVLEVYRPERDAIRELVISGMALGQPLKVPLVIDLSEGPSWMEVE